MAFGGNRSVGTPPTPWPDELAKITPHAESKQHGAILMFMKTQLKLFILVLFVLYPVILYGQDHPELDVATSFAIYKNGHNIFVEYTPFLQNMDTD